MTKTQNSVLQFLSKFKSCSEEQLIYFTNCSIQDIQYLILSNLIIKKQQNNNIITIYYMCKMNNINLKNL